MRILVITSRFPFPLEKGDKLRAYHQIRQLSVHHSIDLVALSHEEVKPGDKEELLKYCSSVRVFRLGTLGSFLHALVSPLCGRPLQLGYFYRPRIRQEISRLIENGAPDLIYCQLLRTALYYPNQGVPGILDLQDCFSAGMERRSKVSRFPAKLVFTIEAYLLRKAEEKHSKRFRHCTIISENDRNLLNISNKNLVHIVPNGVDTEYFRPQEVEPTTDLLFAGNLSYPPNIDAAHYLVKEVLPLLKGMGNEVSLTLAGANPASSVIALSSKQVKVTGWLDDIRSAYASCRVFVAPMRIGTGLQNKLLEAMAMGKPCITSTLANQGLGATPEQEILICDKPMELAKRITELLQNSDRSEKLASAGSNFVRSKYSWDAATRKLLSLIEDAASPKRK